MDGWKCPGCGRCHAPFVASCSACDPSNYRTIAGYPVQINPNLTCSQCGNHAAITFDGIGQCCIGKPATTRIDLYWKDRE